MEEGSRKWADIQPIASKEVDIEAQRLIRSYVTYIDINAQGPADEVPCPSEMMAKISIPPTTNTGRIYTPLGDYAPKKDGKGIEHQILIVKVEYFHPERVYDGRRATEDLQTNNLALLGESQRIR